MFMEDDVSGGENFLIFKIINTVTFLPMRISDKNTTACMVIKLVIRGEAGGIT